MSHWTDRAPAAEEQSGTFFLDNPPPVFVDEIQKAPALFEQIKLYLDRDRKKGQFYLCGSRQFKMMKGVSESLAGRIGLVTLLGFFHERKDKASLSIVRLFRRKNTLPHAKPKKSISDMRTYGT